MFDTIDCPNIRSHHQGRMGLLPHSLCFLKRKSNISGDDLPWPHLDSHHRNPFNQEIRCLEFKRTVVGTFLRPPCLASTITRYLLIGLLFDVSIMEPKVVSSPFTLSSSTLRLCWPRVLKHHFPISRLLSVNIPKLWSVNRRKSL